jgi:hypothetical protein
MQKRFFQFAMLFAATQLFTGCELVEGIFKAGVWVGVLVVVAIIGAVIWVISKFSK